MKKLAFFLILFALAIVAIAQPTQAFKYQTVIRDGAGEILQNQAVALRVSIHDAIAGGAIIYQETFSKITNQFGLINLEIGHGAPTIGTFTGIDWSSNSKFFEVEIDPEGGSNYVSIGSSELASVPYALHAETVTNVNDADADPTNELQTISKAGDIVTLSDGGGSFVDETEDADADSTNELQSVSKAGNIVTLSNGGGSFIDETEDADADPGNETNTSVTLDGTDLKVTDADGTITTDLSSLVDDPDANPTNELQTLSIVGNNLSISNGNVVPLPTGMPAGTSGQTINHDGADWVPSDNLFNDGTNVGIGTTNPGSKLEVDGDVKANRFVDRNNTSYYLDPASESTSAIFNGSVGVGGAPFWYSSGPPFNSSWGPNLHVHEGAGFADIWIGKSQDTVGNELGRLAFVGHMSGMFPPETIYAGITAKINNSGLNYAGSLLFYTATGEGIMGDPYKEQMRLTNLGRLGLGTANPNEKLTIDGVLSLKKNNTPAITSGYGKLFVKSSDNKLYYLNDAGNEYNLTEVGSGSLWLQNGNRIYYNSGNVGIGTSTPATKLEVRGNNEVIRQTSGNDDWRWIQMGYNGSQGPLIQGDGYPRLTIDADAGAAGEIILGLGGDDVGIGITSPLGKLDVNGKLYMRDNIRLNGNYLSGDGGDEGIYVDNNGNAGIGCTPAIGQGKLVVRGDLEIMAGYKIKGYNASNNQSWSMSYGGTNGGFLLENSTGSGNYFYMHGNGYVGIGTDTPLAKLHIKDLTSVTMVMDCGTSSSTARYQAYNNGVARSWSWGVGPNNHRFFIWEDDSQSKERFTILRGGNVGIGTANPSYTLHVNGTAYATGTAGALSDKRHKQNVQSFDNNTLEIIGKLRPVSYEWKTPLDQGMQGTQFGFIAQEVEEILPSVVLTEDNDEQTKALKYSEFIPVLVKALQELKAENEAMKARIASLENK